MILLLFSKNLVCVETIHILSNNKIFIWKVFLFIEDVTS